MNAAPHPRTQAPTVLLAVTCAVTAANVYLCQPILGSVAASLGASPDALGPVATATQLGYALGILLVVPAGDSHDRRRIVLALTAASSLALAACALAPNVAFLAVASLVLGLCSPVPQLITPLAVALTDAEGGGAGRGRTVGAVQGGLLVGVLASRAYAGALAEIAGWRTVYVTSCLLALALMGVLARRLPTAPGRDPISYKTAPTSYKTALASLPGLVRQPLVARVVVSGALVGIAFGAFWTTLTFLVTDTYGFGSTAAGMFGLVAAVSALASPYAGRSAERLGRRGAIALLTTLVLAGWLILLPGGAGGNGSLVALVVGVIVLDVGVWGGQAVCQTVLFTLDPAAHNRLNTVYFTLRFLGIALGSLAGTVAWAAGGWPGVVAMGLAATGAGLVVGVLPVRARAKAPDAVSAGRER
ncbi:MULTISPECIES: MFS transporter [unclassified Streptomyces]|uniref:MFS transporter n=1 Tax=unclassified Streptomyces TaxID=2593676 RepID=UPI00278BD6BB|nr:MULTISPECIES: MFS transporter [unclassified Streptomyces]